MTQDHSRRVALINDASDYVGPAMAREFAHRSHDLVLGNPSPELVRELESSGSTVVAVEGVRNLARPESATALVAAALEAFGKIDAAAAFTFQIIPGKQPRIVNTPEEALAGILKSNQSVFMHGAMATPHELADALPVVADAENLSNIEMCHIHTTSEGSYMTNSRFK